MNAVNTMEELSRELTIRNLNTAMGLHLITPEQAVDAFLTIRRQEQEETCQQTRESVE